LAKSGKTPGRHYGPSYFSDLSGFTGPLDFLLSWVFPAAASVLV